MNDRQHFENLHFNRTINTIDKVPADCPLHWHKYVEVVALPLDAVFKESPRLRVQQAEYRLEPGDLLFIWSGELHELIANTERCLIGMQFEAANINDLPEFAPLLSRFRSLHHIRQSETPELAENLMQHIQQIFALRSTPGSFRGVESFIRLLEMFMDFGKYLQKDIGGKKSPSSTGAYKIAEKMNAACSYIAENCEKELDLDTVADHVGFSSCYFSRVFKQTTDYSFVEYLTLQRVKRAQALLADSDMSVTEVSYQSGFKSISTFNRVFRQYRGCSPREYRKYYLV